MFAHLSRVLDVSFSDCERVLTGRSWVMGLDHNGQELLAAVGVRVAGIPLYKHVQVELREPPVRLAPGRLALPISWHAAGGPPIFPRLDGQLELQHIRGGSRLTLSVTYDPPAGRLGDVLDRALMHRLANATLDDFLRRLAPEIERLAGEPPMRARFR